MSELIALGQYPTRLVARLSGAGLQALDQGIGLRATSGQYMRINSDSLTSALTK